MSGELYFLLSGMMFLQFASWGAWAPVLGAHLLGPLRMSGKQTGWIYATLPLACVISPLVGGQIVDRWLPTEWFLAGAHLLAALFLWTAAKKTSFVGMFLAMGFYSLLYAPTLALVNSLAFHHLPNPDQQYFWVRVWGSIAWVLAGWTLAGWRRWGSFKGPGSDALRLAAMFSLAMGVFCFWLPHTPPRGAADTAFPAIKALSMLKDTNFALFLGITFITCTQLQFYFVGTARYLEEIGVASKNIPAAMALAQIMQTVAMAVILPFILPKVGYRGTLALGILAWALMYLVYTLMRPRWLVVASMMFHGFAFACFFDTAYIYVNKVAPSDIRASAQSLYFMVYGLGLLGGTQFAGVVMDRLRQEGQFRWRPIFAIPCLLLIGCTLACLTVFKG